MAEKFLHFNDGYTQTKKERRRTTSNYVYYSLQLYFSGLLLKNIIKAISLLKEIMFSIYLGLDSALQPEEARY